MLSYSNVPNSGKCIDILIRGPSLRITPNDFHSKQFETLHFTLINRTMPLPHQKINPLEIISDEEPQSDFVSIMWETRQKVEKTWFSVIRAPPPPIHQMKYGDTMIRYSKERFPSTFSCWFRVHYPFPNVSLCFAEKLTDVIVRMGEKRCKTGPHNS